MAIETKQILIRRGLAADTPTLSEGELGLQTDTGTVVVGTPSGNVSLSKVGHTHDDLYYTEGQVDALLADKQDTLVSGTNIKTINNLPLLGTGNIVVAGSAGALEWQYVDKVTSTNGTVLSILGSAIAENFSPQSFDYKFIVDIETTAADFSNPFIQLNGETGSVYNYINERVFLNATQNPDLGDSTIFGGYDIANISTGAYLGTGTQDIALTHIRLEFTVNSTYLTNVPGYQDPFVSLSVDGTGFVTGIDAQSGTPKVYAVKSTYTGNLATTEGTFTRIDITHNIGEGSEDKVTARIYKRAK